MKLSCNYGYTIIKKKNLYIYRIFTFINFTFANSSVFFRVRQRARHATFSNYIVICACPTIRKWETKVNNPFSPSIITVSLFSYTAEKPLLTFKKSSKVKKKKFPFGPEKYFWLLFSLKKKFSIGCIKKEIFFFFLSKKRNCWAFIKNNF